MEFIVEVTNQNSPYYGYKGTASGKDPYPHKDKRSNWSVCLYGNNKIILLRNDELDFIACIN